MALLSAASSHTSGFSPPFNRNEKRDSPPRSKTASPAPAVSLAVGRCVMCRSFGGCHLIASLLWTINSQSESWVGLQYLFVTKYKSQTFS